MESTFTDLSLAQIGGLANTLREEKKYAIIKLTNVNAATYMKY